MRIFWIGFHVEGVQAFRFLVEHHDVVGVMSLTSIAAEKRSGVHDFQAECDRRGLSYHAVEHVNDQASIDIISAADPDLVIVLGWSQILSEEVLSIPSIGCIGAHASLLPEMKGSAPINWALIRGLDKTGNTLMWLDPGVDTGVIIDQYQFEIDIYDSCQSLYEKVAESNKIMLERSLPRVKTEGKVGREQKGPEGELLPRRKPSDGLIDFNQKTLDVYNFIRALTRPYPGAYVLYQDAQVVIWRASFFEACESKGVGVVSSYVYSFEESGCGVIVGTKDGGIIISEITVDGLDVSGRELHNFFRLGDQL